MLFTAVKIMKIVEGFEFFSVNIWIFFEKELQGGSLSELMMLQNKKPGTQCQGFCCSETEN